MNNLTVLAKFTDERLKTVSPLCFVIRFVFCFSSALLLATFPGRAQTPASEQKTITLEELQQMALQNNPTFAQSAANIQAAEGRRKQAGLYPHPTHGYPGGQIRGWGFQPGEERAFISQEIV